MWEISFLFPSFCAIMPMNPAYHDTWSSNYLPFKVCFSTLKSSRLFQEHRCLVWRRKTTLAILDLFIDFTYKHLLLFTNQGEEITEPKQPVLFQLYPPKLQMCGYHQKLVVVKVHYIFRQICCEYHDLYKNLKRWLAMRRFWQNRMLQSGDCCYVLSLFWGGRE